MPIYQYQCDDCGLVFEQKQAFSDPPLSQCPDCLGHVRRVIQPVGVVFKGSGFYVTDNRRVSSPTLRASKDDKPAEKAAEEQAGSTGTPESPPTKKPV